MTIQQYYKQYAEVSLNASLAACIPPFIFLNMWLLVNRDLPILIMTIPFMVYSFFCYQSYLIGKNRYEESLKSPVAQNPSDMLFERKDLLLAFLPAPSLRMLLFSPDGVVVGEVKDLHFWKLRWFLPYFADRLFPALYGLYDENGDLQARICLAPGRSRRIQLYDHQNTLFSMYTVKKQSLFSNGSGEFIFENGEGKIYTKTVNAEIHFQDKKGLKVGGFKKGWMPHEWGKYFKDPNTPIITFHHLAAKEEKIAVIGFLVQQFHYRNH